MMRSIDNIGEVSFSQSKRQKTDIIDPIYNLMKETNQYFDLFDCDINAFGKNYFVKFSENDELLTLQDVFNANIINVHRNKELLINHKKLVSEWSALSSNINKHLDLPFQSHLLRAMKEVNATISEQEFFFPSLPCNETFKPILSHLNTHNSYLSRFSKELAALASVSKKWDSAVYEMQMLNAKEHKRLQTQANLPLECKTVEDTVDFIINNKLEVANLKRFHHLSQELLEKLLKGCPNLKHLLIESDLIKKLPQKYCSQLQTLHCRDCSELESLPDMPQLLWLDCGHCRALASLPDMPQLEYLDCAFCPLSEILPASLTKVKWLDCRGCRELTSLPDMPQLEDLYCVLCPVLERLPASLKKLKKLDCYECTELTSLPEMPQLESLKCAHCFLLETLPASLTKLKKLNCYGCTKFKNLPLLPRLISLNCRNIPINNLEELLKPEVLMQLKSLNCSDCTLLTTLPTYLTQLMKLECGRCTELKSLPSLPKLAQLTCSDCEQLSNIPDMPQLKYIHCNHCLQLSALGNLPQLENIVRSNCPNLIIKPFSLPDSCRQFSY